MAVRNHLAMLGMPVPVSREDLPVVGSGDVVQLPAVPLTTPTLPHLGPPLAQCGVLGEGVLHQLGLPVQTVSPILECYMAVTLINLNGTFSLFVNIYCSEFKIQVPSILYFHLVLH